mmetsp:Transcript_13346/g.15248  ORF Transcript_13346/g.15248 Transcript_13346/m.15248 type:complete len:781 (-) Transcript_13346:357-2699(-)
MNSEFSAEEGENIEAAVSENIQTSQIRPRRMVPVLVKLGTILTIAFCFVFFAGFGKSDNSERGSFVEKYNDISHTSHLTERARKGQEVPKTVTPVDVIPGNCKNWYDGCNTCMRGEINGPAVCTLKMCLVQGEPKCHVYFEEEGEVVAPEDCQQWFDGCNNCVRDKPDSEFVCTLRFCSEEMKEEPVCHHRFLPKSACMEWFDGCNTCTRSSIDDEFTCTRLACLRAETPYCVKGFPEEEPSSAPSNCQNWFDGCNTCFRNEPGSGFGCTEIYCSPEMKKESYCKKNFTEMDECMTWYDGCNTCTRASIDEEFVCTKMYCIQSQTPYCKQDFPEEPSSPPGNCQRWFDGCNMCYRSSPESPFGCTKKYCPPQTVENPYCEKNFTQMDECMKWYDGCNTCTRASIEEEFACTNVYCVQSQTPYCIEEFPLDETTHAPENCQRWFDGCNTCFRSDPESPFGCTKKYCPPQMIKEPYCEKNFTQMDDCLKWYDGCNTCTRATVEDEFSCTEMNCFQSQTPYCILDSPNEESASPSKDCQQWFDGCNVCSRSEPGSMMICTELYCSPALVKKPYCKANFGPPEKCLKWFDGCNTCSRSDVNDTFVCTEEECNEVEESECLEEYEPPTKPSAPKNCQQWFDGCNHCGRDHPTSPFICTLMYCEPDVMQEPYCVKTFSAQSTCMIWFDGCNVCERADIGDTFSCTEMACAEYQEPECRKKFPRKPRKFLNGHLLASHSASSKSSAKWCPESKQLMCRRMCRPHPTCGPEQCLMREDHCCNVTCKDV